MKLTLMASIAVPFLMAGDNQPTFSPPTTPPPVEVTPKITCLGCSPVEQTTAEYFHSVGVKDKKALSVIMGAIKQESRFEPLVCQGGAKTGYHGCKTGGFGIAQWTIQERYNGLGLFAARTKQDPDTLFTQLQYATTEREWKSAYKTFKQTGLAMNSYFHAGRVWLGYGIKGSRHKYAYDYAKRIYVV